MNAWVVRGLGMALIHVVLRSLLGIAITQWPLQGSAFRMISLVLVIIAALLWGWFDAARDRKKNPDPEHGADLTMRWLKASVLGGLLAGFGTWLADFFVNATDNPLFFELTSGAAFTVLLIFVPATLAVMVARMLQNRKASENEGDDTTSGRAHAVAPAGEAEADSGLGTEVLSLDQQHHGDAYAQEYTGQDYTGSGYDAGDSDADTTVFGVVSDTDPRDVRKSD